jgi:hypothetical protein
MESTYVQAAGFTVAALAAAAIPMKRTRNRLSGRVVLYATGLGAVAAFVAAVLGDAFGPASLHIIAGTFVLQSVLSALVLATREARFVTGVRVCAALALLSAASCLLQM